jgi:hypothetical protein
MEIRKEERGRDGGCVYMLDTYYITSFITLV